MRAKRRHTLQEQLVRVIMRVLCRHQDLHYYQVHNIKIWEKTDFLCTVCTCNKALNESGVSFCHLRTYMYCNMSQ